MFAPRTHKLLDPHVNKFIHSDEKSSELQEKIENVIDDQQSLNSSSLSAFSELLNQFGASALDLLNYSDSRDTSRCKLAGLVVFDCLLDVNDDIRPERRFEIANHLCKILENDKLPLSTIEIVLRTAADAVGHFVRIASRTEVDHFGGIAFQLALKLIADLRSETHRFAGALIMTQLSKNAPTFMFIRRQNIFSVIWDLVCDKSSKVRDAASDTLESSLKVISQRETMDEYLQQALIQVNNGFNINTLEKNLSSLIILGILVNGVINPQDLYSTIVITDIGDDLIWKVLQRRDSKDIAVCQKVIEILPNLADAFPSLFVHPNYYTNPDNFLIYSLKFLMLTIRNKKLRSVAYLAIGNLCLNMANQLRTSSILDDVMLVICEGFREPFCIEALESLGLLVSSSINSRKFIDDQIIDMVFKGGLSSSLVDCLKILCKYIPSIRENTQSMLRIHITKILKKYNVLIDEIRGGRSTQLLRIKNNTNRNSTNNSNNTTTSTKTNRESTTMGIRWGGFTSSSYNNNTNNNNTNTTKSDSPINLPINGMSVEEELIFALNLLTLADFFPTQMEQNRIRSSSNVSISAADTDSHQSAQLLSIIRHSVVPYLDDYYPKIRITAALACSSVLDCCVMSIDPSSMEFQYLLQILDRLMMMGVGDDEEDIRICIFNSLTSSLDHIISCTENMHCLIEALNDESLSVRIAAMTVLSRVAHHDTLHVMPVMRLTMKRLILTLINSKDAEVKKESVQLLQALINGSHTLIVPYVRQVIEPLMDLLNTTSVDVVAALSTIGDLALASPEIVREHLTTLSPLLIDALNDTSSISKQETAVIAMGKLVSSLTIEVAEEPYKKYKGLFEGLVRAIQSKDDSSSALRLQAIKTVGLLGIVDINAYSNHLSSIKSNHSEITTSNELITTIETSKDDDSDDEIANEFSSNNGNNYENKLTRTEKAYFSVVIRELMKILKDSSLPHYHITAASVAIKVLRILGSQASQTLPDLKELFHSIMYRIYHIDTPSNTRESLLDHIISIISTVDIIIHDNLDILVKLVKDFAETHLQMVLNIIEALSATSSKPHFYLVLKGVLSTLLVLLSTEVEIDTITLNDEASFKRMTASNNNSTSNLITLNAAADRTRNKSNSNPFFRTNKILKLLNNIAEQLGEYRIDLISVIIKIMDCSHAPVEVRKEALCTVMYLSNNVDLLEFASRIIHPLLRVIDNVELPMQATIVTALSCMVCRLGRGYLPYIIPVRRKLRFLALRDQVGGVGKSRIEEYESLISRLLKQRPLPPEPSDISDLTINREETIRNRTITSKSMAESVFEFDLPSLETVWTLTDRRNNAADLTEWMKRLCIELIRQSTSSIIRSCASLATAYRPLAQGLFYSAFHCIWNELYANENNENFDEIPLITGMETALKNKQSSKKYIVIPLLKLAEYMEMQDQPLSIDMILLADQAKSANMFAKCLYTREIEFHSKNFPPTNECIDSLISVNNQLGLSDNAVGILQYLKIYYPNIPIQSAWLEKLCRWNDAKKSYDEEILLQLIDAQEQENSNNNANNSNNTSNKTNIITNDINLLTKTINIKCNKNYITNMLGKMRCLHALGEYEQLQESAKLLKDQIKSSEDVLVDDFNPWDYLNEVQSLGAKATWMLGNWVAMEEFLEDDEEERLDENILEEVSLDSNITFYRAIMAIHNREYDKANLLIADTRLKLSSNIGSLLSEKYSRAYRAMVTMQVLAEMEEVVDYKRIVDRVIASEKEAVKNSSTDLTNVLEHSSFLHINTSSPSLLLQQQYHHNYNSTTSSSGGQNDLKLMPTTAGTGSAGLADINAKKFNLILKWRGRLESAPKEVDVYRQILAVHTLVTDPTEDLDSWLELVSLCRKERMHSLCENLLRKLGAPLLQRRNSDMQDIFTSPGGGQKDVNSPPDIITSSPSATVTATTSMNNMNNNIRTNDRVMLSTFEYWWAIGEKSRALNEITDYLKVCGVPNRLSSNMRRYSTTEATMFRVECLLKRADWLRELNSNESSVRDTMATLIEARELAGDRYTVWHAWAVANYDYLKKADGKETKPSLESEAIAGFGMPLASTVQPFSLTTTTSGSSTTIPLTTPALTKGKKGSVRKLGGNASAGSASLLSKLSSQQVDTVTPYIIEAIRGFVKSIILGEGQPVANVLQDTLRLITLWFSYGTKKGVFHILEEELEKISPDHWLAVVPQLIARIHIKSPEISNLLRKLLNKVATAHPQALVCPISVALNTNDIQQHQVALEVLQNMRQTRSQLVEEATMVSRELMRVAITPHELWYDGLEQAAQLYMDNKDIHGMLAVLNSLHDAMSDTNNNINTANNTTNSTTMTSISETKQQELPIIEGFTESIGKIGYTTLRDISFRHCYSKYLHEAQHWLIQFKNTLCIADLHQAWEIYQQLFKKIKIQIVNLKKLELHHVSPALTNAKDLSLAIPGTYKPSNIVISIKNFIHYISVIASKQRPRRMSMLGNNGINYEFLLKGHEDLRQDERVMQLFGLINACLNNDNLTNNRNLEIIRYSVLPLSNNSGVIGWVQNCDTINQLIKSYRENKEMKLLIEVKLLHSKCMNYEKLPLIHKVDLFRQVLEETSGKDLAKMLWLKSKTSDIWVERRANFTKSMAVMSMAGYILGLGDRHPSNLMLDRLSGRVVHIDFGDCFEITSQRSKFPEIIPFRLTRMLTTCMGPAGIQGAYRLTCERVMSVLRENRDSLMAMLEAFVYDPLISWRLLANDNEGGGETTVPIASGVSANLQSAASNDDDNISKSSVEQLRIHMAAGSLLGGGGGGGGGAAVAQSMANRIQSMRTQSMRELTLQQQTGLALGEEREPLQENLNARALEVINRIQAKLTGRDFAKNDDSDDLSVEEQVERLIQEATSVENLCQLFTGWCPLW